MSRLLVLAVVVFQFCSVSHAEIMVAPSLEWLADHCSDSGVYVSVGLEEKDGNQSVELSLKLRKAYQGKPAAEIQQDYYKVRLNKPEEALAEKGDQFLVCFQHYTTGEKRVVQLINLNHPQTAGFSVIAASCELKLLKSKTEILKVFEDRLKLHPQGDPVEISDFSKDNRFELQGQTELFSAVYGGSSCYLRVPADLVEQVKDTSARLEKKANPGS